MLEKQGKIMLSHVNDMLDNQKKKNQPLHVLVFWAPFYFAALCTPIQGLQLLTTALIILL